MKQSFSLNPLFSDRMVLQRGQEILVWGTGENGTKVQVDLCGQRKSARCANGAWRILLRPMPAGGPYTMKVIVSGEVLELHDVMIGDVFLAAGQSNMEFPLCDDERGEMEIQKADDDHIRYFEIPRIVYEDEDRCIPELQDTGWQKLSPTMAANVSAVAYYFAQAIQPQAGVAVGIIGCNKGGTSASCWVPAHVLRDDEELAKVYWQPYADAVEDLPEAAEDEQMKVYEMQVQSYERELAAYQQAHPGISLNDVKQAVGHTPWPPPFGRKVFTRPGGLYHTMLRKVMPFHMKAVLWYQGEEDTAHAAVYAGLLKKLILCWRSGFMQHHLPFLIVQLPSFCETKDNVPAGSWASLRAAQSAIAAELPEVGLAVMIDQGEKYNVHPIDKRPVGRRLAMLAMKMLYGKDSGASPRAEHALWSGRDVLVTFDRNLRPAQDILCVEAEDAQGAWQTVSARAEAYGLAVSCNEKPLALRYACQDWCVQANLYGEDNLPVIPFQVEV